MAQAKPGDVVVSSMYGVDFGKLCVEPGDAGIVLAEGYEPDWFGVLWNVVGPKGHGYLCTVSNTDVHVITEKQIWRIS